MKNFYTQFIRTAFVWILLTTWHCEAVSARPDSSSAASAGLIECRLITHPWDKWMTEEPKILMVHSMRSGAKNLLDKQQNLALLLLGDERTRAKNPKLLKLEQELASLKTEIPTTATAYGSKKVRHSYNRSYIDSDGTIHINRNQSSYSGWDRVIKSTSQSLVKSTTNIVLNTTLDDLDQRIESLNKLVATWLSKTAHMNRSGTSGAIWEADQLYIAKIKSFTKKLVVLRNKKAEIDAVEESKQLSKLEIQKEWSEFEKHELPVLMEYINKNVKAVCKSLGNQRYLLPTPDQDSSVIIALKVGQRTIYFDITKDEQNQSPLRLIQLDLVSN